MTRILHLSDVHLQTRERAETTFGQLDSDLKGELGLTNLDAIIITGDNTEFAQESEYEAAAGFVNQLCDLMKVARQHLLVVPGNHDVDWDISKASYEVVRASAAPATSVSRYQDPSNRDYVEVVTNGTRYQRRFQNYAQYHEGVTERDYNLEYKDQYEVITSADNKVVILGLNSAWNVDHYFTKRTSIEASALNRGLLAAKKRVSEIGPSTPIIAAWHHPAQGDPAALQDISFFQRLIVDGVVAALHGHVHKPMSERINYEWAAHGRRLYLLGSGTLDSPDVHRGYPWHYNLITVEGDRIRSLNRGKTERDGAWRPNAIYLTARGKAPTDTLELELEMAERAPWGLAGSEQIRRTPIAPLRTLSELKTRLAARQFDPMGYRIAVEALIFDPNGKLLIQERGPDCRDEVGKLECVGGQVFGEDLIAALRSSVQERFGVDVQIEVDELLDEQPTRHVERHGPEDWMVVSYLCRLTGGNVRAVDPGKTAALHWLDMAELHNIADDRLSRSTSRARDVYRVRFRTRPYFSIGAGLA